MKNAPFALSVLVLVLSGCATDTTRSAFNDGSSALATISAEQKAFKNSVLENEARRIAAQDVARPYIAGNSQPLARSAAMPEQLKKSVTVLFSRNSVDLETALRQVSDAAGILISATPDALLPSAAFGPRITTTATSPVQAPSKVQISVQNTPLWMVLDDIARQAQVSWRAMGQGIEFYRVETRVFSLSAISQTATTSASLGRNGSGNSAFESQSKTSFETKGQNQLTGLLIAVEAMLSVGGKAIIGHENQTLIVTDSKEYLDRIASFVNGQNKAMSRRVRVMLEAIEVVDRDGSELGVDWSVIYNTLNRSVAMASPASLSSALVGSLGVSRASGAASGSNIAVQALSEVGLVVNRRFFPFLTTSGRPVTQAIRSTFNYVDQVQIPPPVASSLLTTSTQTPTVTQKDETVGTFVTIIPTAKPDGTIFLSLSFDQTSAQPLVPFSVGSGDSKVTVQQKTIDGTGIIQEVPVRSGQTIVVGGIESTTTQATIRRLFSGAPLISGGGDTSKLTKSRMVLLVTAVAEEDI